MSTTPSTTIDVNDVIAELRGLVGDHAVDLAIERVWHAATRAQLADAHAQLAAPDAPDAEPA